MTKLEVKDLHAAYQRDLSILRGLDLGVEEGKITIVIGPNGSGKSTLLKSIAGILKPRKGTVTLDQQEITGIELDEIIQRGISYIPQDRAVFPQMTVTENLELGCWIFKSDRARVRERIAWALERFPALTGKRRLLAGTLSLVPDIHLPESHDQAVATVTAALKEQGFGVLTTIDIRSAFQEKLGKAFRPYTILGACNPPLALAALASEPLMGRMLPCNVTVEAAADGGSIVRFANPETLLSVGGGLTHPAVNQVAADATARLHRAAAALEVGK